MRVTLFMSVKPIAFQKRAVENNNALGSSASNEEQKPPIKRAKYNKSNYSKCCHERTPKRLVKTTLEEDLFALTNQLNKLYIDATERDEKNQGVMEKYDAKKKQLQEQIQNDKNGGSKVNAQKKILAFVSSVPRLLVVYMVGMIIDKREGRNLDLMNLLRDVSGGMFICEERILEVADFVLLLNWKVIVAIERKKVPDLTGSVIDERLAKQTNNMEMVFSKLVRVILLVEKERTHADFICDGSSHALLPGPVQTVHSVAREIDGKLHDLKLKFEPRNKARADDFKAVSEFIHGSIAEFSQSVRSLEDLQIPSQCQDDLAWFFADEASYDHEMLSRSGVVGAMINRVLLNGMICMVSESDRFTAFILLKMMIALHSKGKELMQRFAGEPDFDPSMLKTQLDQLTGDKLKQFLGARQIPTAKELEDAPVELTAQSKTFALQLRCLDSWTIDYVFLLVQKYPTPEHLMLRILQCRDGTDDVTKISEFVNELSHLENSSGRRLGPQRAIDLVNFYSANTNYSVKPGLKGKPDKVMQ